MSGVEHVVATGDKFRWYEECPGEIRALSTVLTMKEKIAPMSFANDYVDITLNGQPCQVRNATEEDIVFCSTDTGRSACHWKGNSANFPNVPTPGVLWIVHFVHFTAYPDRKDWVAFDPCHKRGWYYNTVIYDALCVRF